MFATELLKRRYLGPRIYNFPCERALVLLHNITFLLVENDGSAWKSKHLSKQPNEAGSGHLIITSQTTGQEREAPKLLELPRFNP